MPCTDNFKHHSNVAAAFRTQHLLARGEVGEGDKDDIMDDFAGCLRLDSTEAVPETRI